MNTLLNLFGFRIWTSTQKADMLKLMMSFFEPVDGGLLAKADGLSFDGAKEVLANGIAG